MADRMMKCSGKRVASSKLFTVMGMLLSFGVYAEELTDPTQPPARIAMPAVEPVAAEIKAAGLQSILIGKQRRAAIIDGETVELGGMHGAAKLIEVNEASVVMRGPQGKQVLTLFPDVGITPEKNGVAALPVTQKIEVHKIKPYSRREKK